MKRVVNKLSSGVNISFSGDVQKGTIFKMVENCSEGKCDCMSDDTKKKIKDMRVEEIEDGLKITIDGEINKQEIEDALSRSKILN